MRIETRKSRDEIEQQLKDKGFKLIYEWNDDQIWTNEEEDELIWISWVYADAAHYKRTEIQSLLR